MKFQSNLTVRHLQTAEVLLQTSIQLIEQEKGKQSEELAKPLQQLAENSYYFALYHQSAQRFPSPRMQNYHKQLVNVFFKKGLAACQRVADIQAPDGSYNAAAEIALADYLQLFGQHQRASGIYQQVWQQLAQRSDQESIDEYFGTPTRLPNFRPEFEDGIPDFLARVKVDISNKGVPEAIEILQTTPTDNPNLAHHALSIVKSSIFRTPLKQGRAVSHHGFEFNLLAKE